MDDPNDLSDEAADDRQIQRSKSPKADQKDRTDHGKADGNAKTTHQTGPKINEEQAARAAIKLYMFCQSGLFHPFNELVDLAQQGLNNPWVQILSQRLTLRITS
jgi:hypothetical protein